MNVDQSMGRARPQRSAAAHGFTVIEMTVVVALVGVLAAIAVPVYSNYSNRVKIAQAVTDISAISTKLSLYWEDQRAYPDTLAAVGAGAMNDPWGNPYQYLNLQTTKGNGKARKDKSLVPINSDFDLYSMGADGKSVSPLTAKASQDDIIRANDGHFVGLASTY